jgi:acetyltransferase-like isoleucine patch superfamily enzyme
MAAFRRVFFYLKNPRSFFINLHKRLRILHYRLLSDSTRKKGKPVCIQPVLLKGPGFIEFGEHVKFGVENAQGFYSTYGFINVRNEEARIIFGNDITVNNQFSAISEGEGIFIGDRTVLGVNVSIMDTDFHNIDPSKRMSAGYLTKAVRIGQNVWIGNNVTILKGTNIGTNSVIAANSLVNSDIPSNTLAGGNPCRVIRTIP